MTTAAPDKLGGGRRAAAVLFDLDGLLIDSEPVWYDAEFALVERLGGGWSKEHQAACIGGTMDASCRYIIELTGTSRTVEDLTDELLADMAARFAATLPIHTGALELVDAVREHGVATGLVSSSYRVLMDAALNVLGVQRFDVTVAGDEVTRGKPHPEPYLTACARLDVEPARTVVLEDAVNGVVSAEAAGCVVVGVPSVAALESTPQRPVLSSLTEIDVDWLLSLPAAVTPTRSP
jgi:HAD superfamily hydrolase (TIGR01509 family)